MSLAFDEYGRPFIIIKEQQNKQRLKGMEAYKNNILAARSVALTLKTSLGPKGLDKMMVSQDNQVTVTNDGATILSLMDLEHPTAKLLCELSNSQDNEIGDGTTGVVVLAGALLEEALKLIDKGLHPLKISDGFDKACDMALEKLEQISEQIDIQENNNEKLVESAIVALGSKVVAGCKSKLARIAVDAVLSVADLDRKDVNFDLIKIHGKTGGQLEDTQLVNGIVLEKDLSHPQMEKEINDAKILILTCPFEPPKPKTKHNINITNVEDYKKLADIEQAYFVDMVQKCKDSGANLVMCQWGFDDEANHLLKKQNLPAVRWVGGQDIELIAMITGGRIVARFEEVSKEKLGQAKKVKEVNYGTGNEKLLIIEEGHIAKSVTILIRGGSKMILEEAERSIHDAICVVRTLIKDNRIVYGGGSCELACSNYINEQADTISSVEQYAIKGFANALEQIPSALADNSGLDPIETVAFAKHQNNHRIGINCMAFDVEDMKKINVTESYLSKRQQFQLATQVVKMILKIDDVIAPSNY